MAKAGIADTPERSSCCMCKKDLPATRYFKSYSDLYAGLGHLPICKDCLVRMYKQYRIMFGSPQRAMQRICMAFDVYFDPSQFVSCEDNDDTLVGNYFRKLNLGQCKGRTFDTTLAEGFFFDGTPGNMTLSKKGANDDTLIDPAMTGKWGIGFESADYALLEDHYKYLKTANPNSDSNQEIFIMDLCYTKMQQMRAVRESRVDDYNKLTESYRRTFAQAGLKTVQDSSVGNEDCWGVWMERIAQYTPEEYYKNKKLYKDFDGLGDYIQRFVLRPLRNLMYGSQDRDPEYCVIDRDDDHEDEYPDAE